MKIYSLIPKVMADVGAIGKNGVNSYDNYKFRSIDDVYNSLQPALAKNGVFFVPEVLESAETHSTSKNGTAQVRVKQKIKYTFFADDGSSFSTTVEGEAIDRSDKATNKAMTSALKYMLIQVFCIAVAGIDDADSESNEIASQGQAVVKTQKPTTNPLDYKVKFGKFKDKALKDIPPKDLKSMVDWLRNESTAKKKPLTGTALELVTVYEHLQDELSNQEPQFDQDEKIPF